MLQNERRKKRGKSGYKTKRKKSEATNVANIAYNHHYIAEILSMKRV